MSDRVHGPVSAGVSSDGLCVFFFTQCELCHHYNLNINCEKHYKVNRNLNMTVILILIEAHIYGDLGWVPFYGQFKMIFRKAVSYRTFTYLKTISAIVKCWHFFHQVDIPEIDRLLVQLEELSCTCPHVFAYTFAAKCFAGLVNKRPAGTQTRTLSSFQITRPTFSSTLPNGRLFLINVRHWK